MTAPTRHVCFFTLSTQSSRSATRLFVPTPTTRSVLVHAFCFETSNSLVKAAHTRDCSTPPLLLHAHTTNSKSESPNMSGYKPYHVDKFRVGDD
jgi:hypothetical protein